jgi:putative GTP pyrophosphokinase
VSIYGDRLAQLEAIVEKGKTLIQEIINEEVKVSGISPIEHFKYRIKCEESLIDKLNLRGLPVTMESIYTNIHDLVGFRIVCSYTSGVRTVANKIIYN